MPGQNDQGSRSAVNFLPISVDDLVSARSVESCRIEYKAAFDERNKLYVVATVSAFANDLQNLNGGYIIIGIEAPNGVPALPPAGIEEAGIERTSQSVRVACKKIDPDFQPLIAPAVYEDKHILVLWVPAGDNRPYRTQDPRKPENRALFVRVGPETVKATGVVERQLIELTARIPFDESSECGGECARPVTHTR
jgi:ATP-dependent DNA helicase RecG